MSTGLFDLRGIKPGATRNIRSLVSLGFLLVPETIQCGKCSERYVLMADLAGIDAACLNAFDKDNAIQALAVGITAEHESGHQSVEVALVCELHLHDCV